jgi:hypothetical protein
MIETMGVVAAVLVVYTATMAYVVTIGSQSNELSRAYSLEAECSGLESIVSAVHSCGDGCRTRFEPGHDIELYPGFAIIHGEWEEPFFCRVGDYTANSSAEGGGEYEVENAGGIVRLR